MAIITAEQKFANERYIPILDFPAMSFNKSTIPKKSPLEINFPFMPITIRRYPVDLTFPYKPEYSIMDDNSIYAQTIITTSDIPRNRITRKPPNYDLPFYKATPFKPIERASERIQIIPQANPLESPLLSLPVEIRLKIYHYVIASHPAKHVHLSPSYIYPSSVLMSQGRSEPLTLMNLTYTPGLSPAFPKRIGYVPANLLRTCQQIYHEARDLPFQNCEFTFVNWFCSGIFAASSFLRSLREWQTDSIRWVGLEALGRDLVGVGVGCGLRGRNKVVGEWEDVCNILHGVWGLRLVVKGRVDGDVVTEERIVHHGDDDNDDEKGKVQWIEDVAAKEIVHVVRNAVLDTEATWIKEGLARFTDLRWLELCIEDDNCDAQQKEDFCEQLRKLLRVQVLLIEKHREEEADDDVHEGDTPTETPPS